MTACHEPQAFPNFGQEQFAGTEGSESRGEALVPTLARVSVLRVHRQAQARNSLRLQEHVSRQAYLSPLRSLPAPLSYPARGLLGVSASAPEHSGEERVADFCQTNMDTETKDSGAVIPITVPIHTQSEIPEPSTSIHLGELITNGFGVLQTPGLVFSHGSTYSVIHAALLSSWFNVKKSHQKRSM